MKKLNIRITLLIGICLFAVKISLAQKHFFKGTPIKYSISKKFNLGYEHKLNNKFSLFSEYQRWNQSDKKSRGIGFQRSLNASEESTNKGNRFLFGVRHFIDLTNAQHADKKDNSFSAHLYLGFIGFSGKHKITHHMPAYINNQFGFLWEPVLGVDIDSETVSERNGEVTLISKGMLLEIGTQFVIEKNFFFEIGLRGGRSRTNKSDNYVRLIPQNPEDDIVRRRLPNTISGVFIEAMISIGVAF